MNCPTCGTAERVRVHTCQMCGSVYSSEDSLEAGRLEFLLTETAAWPEANVFNRPYADRLAALKARLLPKPPAPAVAVVEPPKVVPQPITPLRPKPEPAPVRPEPARPVLPPVPFDQWLLSERNIKIALYSGAILLVLAGLIFVAVNWVYIPGPAKFAITLTITGLTYLGGYLLFQRPLLRPGGVALLGVASGFVPLNFVVLQIYVLSAYGLNANVMWFIGSWPALLLYTLTAYWTRASLFTYLALAATASLLTAALVLLAAPLIAYVLVYAVWLIALLWCAHAVRTTPLASFTYQPLLITCQLAMPAVFLAGVVLWSGTWLCGTPGCINTSPGLALAAMFVGVIFYVVTDVAFRRTEARWAAAGTSAVTFVCVLIQLGLSGTALGVALMTLASAYLCAGGVLERRSGQRSAAWPLYTIGYVLAAFVTFQALVGFGLDQNYLTWALLGDSALFVVSAWAQRRHEWLYGAAWVLIAPVFLYSERYLLTLPQQVMRLALALAYLCAGYVMERRRHKSDAVWLYAAGCVVAAFVTVWATPTFRQDPTGLANALIGDVIFFVVSARLHRQIEWLYGAVWMFIVPVFIYAGLQVEGLSNQGVVLGVLMLNYAVIGYALGRRVLKRGGPFLTAAAFLSVVVVAMTWGDVVVASLALEVIATLYLLATLWLRWSWLLLPALAAVHVAVLAVLRIFFAVDSTLGHALILIAAGFGVVLALGGSRLRQSGRGAWGWPLYLVAACDVAGSYAAGLSLGGPPVVGLSAGFALLALVLAWSERMALTDLRLPPVLTYLAIAFVFAGHFAAIDLVGGAGDAWPIYTAGLCALLVALAWRLRSESLREVYGTPLRQSGMWLMLIPAGGVLTTFEPLVGALTFAIAGMVYAADAVVRQPSVELSCLAGGAFVVSYFFGLPAGTATVIGLSLVFALLTFGLAWLERDVFIGAKLPPLLTYLGALFIFAGLFYVVNTSGAGTPAWPVYTAGLCAAYVMVAGSLQGQRLKEVYGTPLCQLGMWLIVLPFVGAFATFDPGVAALTFATAGVAYGVDAAVRRNSREGYLAGGAFVVAIWSSLILLRVNELQAYVLPFGLGWLVLAWNERRLDGQGTYRWPMWLGLLSLLGSAFYQSLGDVRYAVWLLAESLAALAWGLRIHSRSYVQVGVLALIVNAVAQFGPGFVELPRWIQLALIGSLLLGGGLVALFRREQLLTTRQRLAAEWRQWES